ncbi:ATPase PAAT [Erpetoichthys calabaricus]|uniref:Si:rp71-19m20.1 n=1 Tax=Erpetoichthys calabaricus TaxID=27687 RepID=A0A8C4X903_ERPCA|nr:ATPase PAAT [Erpetoichthys calabaricus]
MQNQHLLSNKQAVISVRLSWNCTSEEDFWGHMVLANNPTEFYEATSDTSDLSELLIIQQPQGNETDIPCVVHLQCIPQAGIEIVCLHVVSQARTMEVYSSSEYCGTCRGEPVHTSQDNCVKENVLLYKKNIRLDSPTNSCEIKLLSLQEKPSVAINKIVVEAAPVKAMKSSPAAGVSIDLKRVQNMMESMGTRLSPGAQHLMDMVQFQQKNSKDMMSSFLPLLLRQSQFKDCNNESMKSAPTIITGSTAADAIQTTEQSSVNDFRFDHTYAESSPNTITEDADGQVQNHECHRHQLQTNGILPSTNHVKEINSFLCNQTWDKQNTSATEMFSLLQRVCGQVQQLRLNNMQSDLKTVPGEDLCLGSEQAHSCCSTLEVVIAKKLESIEQKLMDHIDHRMKELQENLQRTILATSLAQKTERVKAEIHCCRCTELANENV